MGLNLVLQKEIYDELLPKYAELENIVLDILEKALEESDIKVMQLPHRLKTWTSIEGKMHKKPEKYSQVSELSDILGLRIICFFADQVDEAARVLQRVLDVDYTRSKDKRRIISPDAFGYLSLHYICTLPKDKGYPEELIKLRFEIQLRTILQHAWAEIEHDLGYKSVFEVPRNVRREFSRVAGLLEIADEAFEQIRNHLSDYERDIMFKISNDAGGDLTLDRMTLREYMKHSPAMRSFLMELSEVYNAEITEMTAEKYLHMLDIMKIETLGDLQKLVVSERTHAIMLAKRMMEYSDLDELSSAAGVYYLVRAKMIWGGYTENELRNFYLEYTRDAVKADRAVRQILRHRKNFGV